MEISKHANHIMLLPSQDYWEWVAAAQAFVQRFDVYLTPDPHSAVRLSNPGDIISVVKTENGYPGFDPVDSWFQENIPQAELDLIEVANPSALHAILATRIEVGDPLENIAPKGRRGIDQAFDGASIQLLWPTDYAAITQHFSANPEIFVEQGLPGHDGLDIRAPYNSPIYACAEGEVFVVHEPMDDGHPYGRHLGILHANGYRTLYAHLSKIDVKKGQKVNAGQTIGLANATGSSPGSHLHLTLRRDGATAGGLTHFANDVIDPTPFLTLPEKSATLAAFPWPLGRCLAGVNSHPEGIFTATDFEIIQIAKMEAVKLAHSTSAAQITRLRQLDPAFFLMTGLHIKFQDGVLSPAEWIARLRPHIQRHYEAGIRHFELQRAPNVVFEGCFSGWKSGAEFARWWLETADLLKTDFPDVHLGFPGLSTGDRVEGLRLEAQGFLEGAETALQAADWLGVHSYWTSLQELEQENRAAFFRRMRRYFPEKMIFVTEFGNVNSLAGPREIGREMTQFFSMVRREPGIGAAFAQILATSGAYANLAWRTLEGEPSPIIDEIAKRQG